ncbi:hypothetical protein [Alkalihalobacillus sp. AL-G]|uniref:coiled-coil domain-containing protein n=1 Tax=Alkalihalobacillus sp. AL-G TaxID=2926399 RepID=UPI00272CAFAB|nr:hypothetical protein [Alkalihalobacillus sp. AL-G]WLD94522.1 hypothetical protein MOJ78_06450 [Alkalihalobacillus sp. AL-G]
MGKKILLTISIVLLLTTTVYAHVSGSFKDFLSGIQDQRSTEKLKKEIQKTREEIEQLTPEVNQLEKEYSKKAEKSVLMLQFYRAIGLDTYMKFITSSNDIVDVLANRRFVEMKLEEDLQELNDLYLSYMPVKMAKNSLEGHMELLKMIEGNLQARQTFFQSHKNSTPEEMANIAVTTWEENASHIDDDLYKDSKLFNEHIKEFVTRKTSDSPYRFVDDLFNKKAKLTYFFRSDHIYVNYHKKDADVILIGQIFKIGKKSASLQFEAGFLNGIQLSNDLLKKLPGLKIDYGHLAPESETFYVEQVNGAIVIQPIENAVE